MALFRTRRRAQPEAGFLTRLRKDVRGNTLAIMAAAVIPLAGMVGGGIDLARIYITKTRLQHACDAGALAGRKAMGGGQWSQGNGKPNTIARTFFNANYKVGSFGSDGLTYGYTESAGKVIGNATANLPMTLTRVLGETTKAVVVTCEAEMRLPNTDVMFVLDNTGSMNDKAKSTDTQTKMAALKSAVKCFYEILARLDTTEVCVGDAPSGGTSDEVQIRFGFVPYDTNVNVGRLLPSSWFKDRWTYQSREITEVTGLQDSFVDDTRPEWKEWSTIGVSSLSGTYASEALCKEALDNFAREAANKAMGLGKTESNGGLQGWGNWVAEQTWRETERLFVDWNLNSSNRNKCRYKQRTRDYKRTFTFRRVAAGMANGVVFRAWLYRPVEFDLTPLKSGDGWVSNYAMSFPTGNNYVSQSRTWGGCIEERATVRQTSYMPIPDGARDLDLDNAPTSDEATRWAPAIGDIVYARKETYDNNTAWSMAPITTFTNFTGKNFACVREAAKLGEWKEAGPFESYVDSMVPGSNTYHDIGMIWGGRFLSPNGMFKAENEFTPTGGKIQRHLIFMTDGDACTEDYNYQAYGLAWYDRRQTPEADVPTDGCSNVTTPGTLTAQVNARLAAVCTQIRNFPDTTLWVIWFGVSQPKIEANLRACATTDRFFAARDSESLQNTFRTIANQISQLRVTN